MLLNQWPEVSLFSWVSWVIGLKTHGMAQRLVSRAKILSPGVLLSHPIAEAVGAHDTGMELGRAVSWKVLDPSSLLLSF